MSKILVIGARGMLGHKLCQMLPDMGYTVVGAVRGSADSLKMDYPEVYGQSELIGQVDATDDACLEATIKQIAPDVVVNAVGIVKQLKEAKNPLLSIRINSYLPHKLAQLTEQQECRLIHISTDCIFSGRDGKYTETSPSDAEDLYGQSKYLGETNADEPSAVTLRTSFIGREIHKPTHGLIEWFLSEEGNTIGGFSKAIYTGLTSLELVKAIAAAIEHPELCGVYQAASEPIDKFALLQLAKEAYGVDITIQENDQFTCDRSILMGPFAEKTGYRPPDWKQMLSDMAADSTPYARYLNESE